MSATACVAWPCFFSDSRPAAGKAVNHPPGRGRNHHLEKNPVRHASLFPWLRRLAHTVDLVYPKWIPGNHAPTGPIADLVNLRFTADGKSVAWVRDPVDMFRFHIPVPAGTNLLVADFSLVGAYAGGKRFRSRQHLDPGARRCELGSAGAVSRGHDRRPGNCLRLDQASRQLVLRDRVAASVAAGRRHSLRSCVADHADRFSADVRIHHARVRHHAERSFAAPSARSL